MMAAAATIFVYYTTWAILVVRVVAASNWTNSHIEIDYVAFF